MNIKELKRMLEQTQREYPPHYPTKTHDVGKEISILQNNLKTIVDFIGFSEANIAIKNIVGKMINEFLISTLHGEQIPYCNFEITAQELDNRIIIIVSYKDKTLELEYIIKPFEDHVVINITNNSHCSLISYGEDYSESSISYSTDTPNNLYLYQKYQNKSSCQSIMTFNEYGIEMNKEFLITPSSRNYIPENQYLVGTITRTDDFYTANVKLNTIGDDFKRIINNEEIDMIKSIPEITAPIRYFGSLKTDLNLLRVMSKDDRTFLRNGGILDLVDNYCFADESSESFEEEYAISRNIIKDSFFLEIAPDSLSVMLPLIHSPYSPEILKGIKKYVKKLDSKQ